MVNMIRTISGKEPELVYLDIVDASVRQDIWGKSGKKGVYPLLFVDEAFVGDVRCPSCDFGGFAFAFASSKLTPFFDSIFLSFLFLKCKQYDMVEGLNESEQLHGVLGVDGH